MLNEEIILSILIATKNRVPYCINTIQTILQFDNNNFELIIQDNTDSMELKNYIESSISDPRIIYNYTPPPFSSIDNFNATVDLASGKYLCLIGDDDSVCPQVFELAKWADEMGIESVCGKSVCEYIWPRSLNSTDDSTLKIPPSTGTFECFNPRKQLVLFLINGASDYQSFHLPKIYHGLIKRSSIQNIKAQTGHYFGGLSPDIYAAVTLACSLSKHFVVDFPVTIAGACNQSTTISSYTGDHVGKLSHAPHFRDRGPYIWEKLIPRIYSVDTIWAETALKALSEVNKSDLKINFNFELFLVKNLLRNRNIFFYNVKKSIECLRTNKKGILSYFKIFYLSFRTALRVLYKVFFIRFNSIKNENKTLTFFNIADIKEATAIATEVLSKRKIFFSQKANLNENCPPNNF